jgi:ATP-dependent Clp protease ATP-binding subunit ClpA
LQVIVFEALSPQQQGSVASLMLKELVGRCEENEVTLTTDSSALLSLVPPARS